MLTAAIARPPFTYITFFSFLCNLIYMRISFQSPLVHCIYMCMYFFWLISFLPVIGFSLFVLVKFTMDLHPYNIICHDKWPSNMCQFPFVQKRYIIIIIIKYYN
jgi:hypothetical protein